MKKQALHHYSSPINRCMVCKDWKSNTCTIGEKGRIAYRCKTKKIQMCGKGSDALQISITNLAKCAYSGMCMAKWNNAIGRVSNDSDNETRLHYTSLKSCTWHSPSKYLSAASCV